MRHTYLGDFIFYQAESSEIHARHIRSLAMRVLPPILFPRSELLRIQFLKPQETRPAAPLLAVIGKPYPL